MLTPKQLKQAQQGAARQQLVLKDLQALVTDIERAEKVIIALKTELESVNTRHEARRTTREDIAYLTDLLDCAKKKLAWEKQIGSLQKRTPEVLGRMQSLLQDPLNPPSEETRERMMASLKSVQSSMERLQSAKVL